MKTIIIGGGITGLSCAYKLQLLNKDYVLVEKEEVLGGLCKSVSKKNFIFDYTGHFLHFSDNYIKKFIKNILNGDILKIKRNSKIFTLLSDTKYHLIPFPFQANIGYLNNRAKNYCIKTLLESNIFMKDEPVKNFYDWSIRNFGAGITNYFFSLYNKKLFQTNIKKISIDWVTKFVPKPNIEEIFYNVLNKEIKSYGYNSTFYYPRIGGIQNLINSIEKRLDKKNILKNICFKKLDIKNKIVFLTNGLKIRYDNLISTIPLTELLENTNVSETIKNLSKKLKYTSVLCFNIALKNKIFPRKNECRDEKIHWIYFPSKETIFYRVGFYHNINENLVPSKKFGSLYVEVSCFPEKKFDVKNVYDKIVCDLIKTKILFSEKEILFYNFLQIPVGYVIYDFQRKYLVEKIQKYLMSKKVFSIGRYGGWKYSYMEENVKDGFYTVDKIFSKS